MPGSVEAVPRLYYKTCIVSQLCSDLLSLQLIRETAFRIFIGNHADSNLKLLINDRNTLGKIYSLFNRRCNR